MSEIEIPRAPKLSDLPDPNQDITDVADRLTRSEGQTSPLDNEAVQSKEEDDIVKYLGMMPEGLQTIVRDFYHRVARDIISYQTASSGDHVEVRVTDDRLDHYRRKFNDIIEGGFLNPYALHNRQ